MAFDPSSYTTMPQTGAPGTLAVVTAVISASKDVVEYVSAKKALKRLRAAGERLRLGYKPPAGPKSESAKRAMDTKADRSWGSLEMRLAAACELEGEAGEAARRAREALFPNGLEFLKMKYREQWIVADAMLKQLVEEDREAAVSRIAGPEYLSLVRERHVAYGEVLGITKPLESAAEVAKIAELLSDVRLELGKYARVIAAGVENSEIEEHVALAALKPVDDLRIALRNAKKKGEAEPEEPPLSPDPLPPVE
jgi:hypothetical protein